MNKKKDPREPIQKRGKDKKKRILLASKQLFIKNNYFNVSTNEIAKQAGVSIGTLYSYFSSKEDILTELLADYSNSFLPIFEKISSQTSFEAFKEDTKAWLESLVDQLVNSEDIEFHSQIEMLAYAIPKVCDFQNEYNEKLKNLTYECFLYYAQNTNVHEVKILSVVVFDYISALVDELLYNKHSISVKNDLKQCGINSIYTIIVDSLKE